MNNKEIRSLSREQLQGKWLVLAGVNFAAFLVAFIVYWFMNEFLWILVAIPAVYAIRQLCFDVAKGAKEINFNSINFTLNSSIGIYVYSLIIKVISRVYMLIKIIVGILVAKKLVVGAAKGMMESMVSFESPSLGSMKSIIFGIIAFELIFLVIYLIVAYVRAMYFFTEYILMREEGKNIIQVMKESRMMMKGHIKEFILFELSFAGWYILSILSFGIGFAFLSPYMKVANAHYYMKVLKEEKGVEAKRELANHDMKNTMKKTMKTTKKISEDTMKTTTKLSKDVASKFKASASLSKEEYAEFKAWMDEKKAEEAKILEEEKRKAEAEKREFEEWKKFKAMKEEQDKEV